MRAVNLSLDEESLAIAAEIHPRVSVAVRLALAAWKAAQGKGV